jgi:hypothetical protein
MSYLTTEDVHELSRSPRFNAQRARQSQLHPTPWPPAGPGSVAEYFLVAGGRSDTRRGTSA